eukprot:scaffold2459_cov72-Phaeocystis_antarctica.AAC.2
MGSSARATAAEGLLGPAAPPWSLSLGCQHHQTLVGFTALDHCSHCARPPIQVRPTMPRWRRPPRWRGASRSGGCSRHEASRGPHSPPATAAAPSCP